MKRTAITLCALAILLAGCPQKPNPYCPNNTCGTSPTNSVRP